MVPARGLDTDWRSRDQALHPHAHQHPADRGLRDHPSPPAHTLAAAELTGASRGAAGPIFAGQHFRHDERVGQALGGPVDGFLAGRALNPIVGESPRRAGRRTVRLVHPAMPARAIERAPEGGSDYSFPARR
jgi:hypothetical protein